VWLPWRDLAPLPEFPDLKVWTSLTEIESDALRHFADGKRVIEIGAAFGYSTLLLASVAEHVWSIDPHTASVVPGNFDLRDEADLWRLSAGTLAILQANLTATGLWERVTICKASSQDYLTRESPDADFAFIDGDHSKEVCAADIRNCDRLLKAGDMICVHDYDDDSCPGVREAVNERGGQRRVIDSLAVLTVAHGHGYP
jgi:cephalosporin hydroxylase